MKRLILIVLLATLCMSLLMCNVVFADTAQFSTSARGAIVMERSTRRVLFEKNSDLCLPMASTTKIVTALTVLRNTELDEVVEIPKAACGIEGSSVYLREGEHLTVRELLYALMLRSGNDCATALALHVSGSIESFADLMNVTARDLGCKSSHFANPHGLHDDAHYTTAHDLAVITCAALENNDFQEIVATKVMRISNEGYEYDRVLVNKNKLLSRYDFADGVKTGFTKKAGRCFVGSATQDDMQVVVVVLNCGPMFEETENMLKVAFANYKLEKVVPKNKICGSVLYNGIRRFYICRSDFSYPISVNEKLASTIDLERKVMMVMLNGEVLAALPLEIL